MHFRWTCCFQDKDFFETTSVDDGVIKVFAFAIKKIFQKAESVKIYKIPTEIFHSHHTPRSMTINTKSNQIKFIVIAIKTTQSSKSTVLNQKNLKQYEASQRNCLY